MVGTEGAVKKGARAPPQLIQVPHLPTGPVLVKRSLLHHHPSRPLLKKNKKDLDETRSKPWRTPHPDQDRPRSAPTTTTVSRPLVSQPAMCLCVCLSVCVCWTNCRCQPASMSRNGALRDSSSSSSSYYLGRSCQHSYAVVSSRPPSLPAPSQGSVHHHPEMRPRGGGGGARVSAGRTGARFPSGERASGKAGSASRHILAAARGESSWDEGRSVRPDRGVTAAARRSLWLPSC